MEGKMSYLRLYLHISFFDSFNFRSTPVLSSLLHLHHISIISTHLVSFISLPLFYFSTSIQLSFFHLLSSFLSIHFLSLTHYLVSPLPSYFHLLLHLFSFPSTALLLLIGWEAKQLRLEVFQ